MKIEDIIVGDEIRYSYMVYGTQVLSWGKVEEILENGLLLITTKDREVEVPIKSVLERKMRKEEYKTPVTVHKDPEDVLNEGISGVRFKRRNHYGKKN